MALDVPESIFGEITPTQFLSEYWQKKPLLVRGAWPDFKAPVTPADLKAIACRDDVEGRLVLERGGDYPWELRFGPFEPEELDELPSSHWTLLVQHMDRLHPEVGKMLEGIQFLPNWRLDDIMISYAPGEGGVGAHIDNYDVFLVQGFGQRKWQINTVPVAEENIVPDLDVSILADFVADQEWILEPGDMLYLPPRIAHFGVALGDCMTYSIGCRAPSKEGLVTDFLEHVLASSTDEHFFSDPDRMPAERPGEVGSDIKLFARTALSEALSDGNFLDRWLGEHLTRGIHFEDDDNAKGTHTKNELLHQLSTGARLRPETATRVAFDRMDNGDLLLFVDGTSIDVASDLQSFLDKLTKSRGIDMSDMPIAGSTEYEAATDLVFMLYASGFYKL
jgi:50S ribosomal protein L16 3-hydroxylase